MKEQGFWIQVSYVAKRKRKPRFISFAGATLQECLDCAKDFLRDNQGKYVQANKGLCDRWLSHVEDGREVWFFSVACGHAEPMPLESVTP